MSNSVFITGGTGYIGQHVVRRFLADGWRVTCLVRTVRADAALPAGVEQVRIGELDELTALFQAQAPDIVVHLASAIIHDHRPEDLDPILAANVRLPCLLLEAMRGSGCRRFLNTGSFWQNYKGQGYHPVNLYAASKQAFQDLLLHYTDLHGMAAITLKLFETYGGDNRRKLIPSLLDTARTNVPLKLSLGEQTVDMTHVEDVADAFLVVARQLLDMAEQDNRTYFVSGQRLTVRELAELVERTAGKALNVELGGRPYRVREIMKPLDVTGQTVPGWQPRRDLVTEIERDIAAQSVS